MRDPPLKTHLASYHTTLSLFTIELTEDRPKQKPSKEETKIGRGCFVAR